MRLQLLQGCALALSALQVSDAATCKTMMDANNMLVESISAQMDESLAWFPFADVFEELDTALPWLSTCAAAMDPVMVYTAAVTSSNMKACLTTVQTSEIDMDLSNPDGMSEICSLVEGTVVPCIKNAMTEIVMDAFDTTNGCCDAFLSEMEALFTDPIDVMVEKLLQLMVNIPCAERSFTNLKGKATTEMCGYSIYRAFTVFDPAMVMDLLQIPNQQMCKAMDGAEFTTTNGSTTQFSFGTQDVDTMGICSQTLDAMTKHLASWPFFQQTLDANGTSFSLSDWFTTGKSITASTLIRWFFTPTNLPMMIARTIEKAGEAIAAQYGSGSTGDGEYTDSWYPVDWASSYVSDWSGSWSSSYADDHDVAMVEPMAPPEEWSATASKDEMDMEQIVDGVMAYAETLKLHIPNEGNCVYTGEEITLPFAVSSTSSANGSNTTAVDAQSSGAMSATSFPILVTGGVTTVVLVVMGLAF